MMIKIYACTYVCLHIVQASNGNWIVSRTSDVANVLTLSISCYLSGSIICEDYLSTLAQQTSTAMYICMADTERTKMKMNPTQITCAIGVLLRIRINAIARLGRMRRLAWLQTHFRRSAKELKSHDSAMCS